jgi:hypothetical protein
MQVWGDKVSKKADWVELNKRWEEGETAGKSIYKAEVRKKSRLNATSYFVTILAIVPAFTALKWQSQGMGVIRRQAH